MSHLIRVPLPGSSIYKPSHCLSGSLRYPPKSSQNSKCHIITEICSWYNHESARARGKSWSVAAGNQKQPHTLVYSKCTFTIMTKDLIQIGWGFCTFTVCINSWILAKTDQISGCTIWGACAQLKNTEVLIRGLSFIKMCTIFVDMVKSAQRGWDTDLWLCLCVSEYRSQQLTLHMGARSNGILLMPSHLPRNGLFLCNIASRAMLFFYVYYLFKNSNGSIT